MGVKIAVVGAGSTYTPELVEGLAAHSDRIPVERLCLFDIDAGRLEVVGGFARRILAARGWPDDIVTLSTNRDEALEGADFVVLQFRVGGQATRLVDETLPLEFGCIGQETTGPGGFAKGLRTVPVALDLANTTKRLAAPDAWIVNFTNPVGIVTQALLDEGHRAIGLCNVAIGFERRFAERFGVSPGKIRLDHAGLNHLSWIRRVLVDDVDRLPELLADEADLLAIAEDVELDADLIRRLGAIPSYYLRYYYETAEVLAEQRAAAAKPRAQEVIEIEEELLTMYRDSELAAKPALLEQRGGAYYSDAATRLIASLHDGAGDEQVVDIRNDGAIDGLSDDAVVEIPAAIAQSGARARSGEIEPLAAGMLGLVQHVKAYERLAVIAARTGDRDVALDALMTNPLVGDYGVAVPLLDALLEANRVYLPAFFPLP